MRSSRYLFINLQRFAISCRVAIATFDHDRALLVDLCPIKFVMRSQAQGASMATNIRRFLNRASLRASAPDAGGVQFARQEFLRSQRSVDQMLEFGRTLSKEYGFDIHF